MRIIDAAGLQGGPGRATQRLKSAMLSEDAVHYGGRHRSSERFGQLRPDALRMASSSVTRQCQTDIDTSRRQISSTTAHSLGW